MSQQMAMASLNEDILSDWKKNGKNFKNLDEFLSEYKKLQSDCQSLKQEGFSLKVELSEMLESHDQIKDQFGQLLDRFQEYIAEREADQLEKEEQQQS